MRTNTIKNRENIHKLGYGQVVKDQPLPSDTSGSCGGPIHIAPLNRAAPEPGEIRPEQSPSREGFPIEPFCWYYGGVQTAEQEVVEKAHDLANGIFEILALLEHDDIGEDCGKDRILKPSSRGSLMRMAITSAKLLSEECAGNIEYVNRKRLGE